MLYSLVKFQPKIETFCDWFSVAKVAQCQRLVLKEDNSLWLDC